MPRFSLGQRIDTESPEQLSRILERMEELPWRQALAEIVPDSPLQDELCRGTGAEFVYSMPWDEIHAVLEIGAGMGALTSRLVEREAQVVTVEMSAEKALFQRRRAMQDGYPNWHPIIASYLDLPFAPESFDLIAMNGVLESIGLWIPGNPRRLQAQLLEQAARLLKPNGYLYLGAQTRFSLNHLRGQRDPSGQRFTGLLPRILARLLGNRACTHTPTQYARMARAAGFESVETYGAHDSIVKQKAVYPLNEPTARRVTREIADPPSTWRGRWLRSFSDLTSCYKTLENEVIVFARKQGKVDRLAWVGLPHDGPITQFSTENKVFVLCFKGGEPESVVIVGKNAYANDRLQREHAFLKETQRRHGLRMKDWPMRWPTPRGVISWRGQTLYRYEFVRGSALNRPLQPVAFDVDAFIRFLSQAMDRYIDLCAILTAATPTPPSVLDWDQALTNLAKVRTEDAPLAKKLQSAADRFRPFPALAQIVHGDLSLCNVVVRPDGSMVLIDWENVSPVGFVALDLLRLLFDTWDDLGRMNPHARSIVMPRAKETTRLALRRLNLGPADYADLEALFVAHQMELGNVRSAEPSELLTAYRQGAIALGD